MDKNSELDDTTMMWKGFSLLFVPSRSRPFSALLFAAELWFAAPKDWHVSADKHLLVPAYRVSYGVIEIKQPDVPYG